MNGRAAAVTLLVMSLLGCTASASPQAGVSTSVTSTPATSPPAGSPAPTSTGAPSPVSSEAMCPGETWPPFDLGGVPGLSAIATDRANVLISNRSGRTWYYRLAGWEFAQLETCREILESELERGPIRAGSDVRTTLGYLIGREDVPVTIAFWDEPCGEGCRRPPVGGLRIDRSPLEPPSS